MAEPISPPLVLLHAFPLDSRMWEGVRGRLAARTRLITPDLRGLGRTELPAGDREPDLADAAADVIAMLDRIGLDRVVLGGCSMGGYVTMAVLRAAPERVAGVVLLDTKAEADRQQARQNRRQVAERAEQEGIHGWLATEMLPNLLAAAAGPQRDPDSVGTESTEGAAETQGTQGTAEPQSTEDTEGSHSAEEARAAQRIGESEHTSGSPAIAEPHSPDVVRHTRDLIDAQTPSGVAWAQRAMANRSDSTATLRAASVPALVLVGEHDALTEPADARRMAATLPASSLVTIPEAGHLAPLEAPEAVADAISAWLTDVGLAASE